MSEYYPLSSLEISNEGKPICVQIIKDWKEKFNYHRGVRILILADEQGNRIAGTVHNYLLSAFIYMELGQWYKISKYQVKPNPDVRKWTEHDLHIFFEDDTLAVWCGPRKEDEMTFYRNILEITNYTVSSKMSIVDVIGGVVSVWKKVDKQVDVRGSNINATYSELKFTVADHTGLRINCFAIGQFANDFEMMWIDRNLENVVFVALKYWDIRVHDVEGSEAVEIVLYGENTYSEILIPDTDKVVKQYCRKYRSAPVFSLSNIEDGYEEYIAELNQDMGGGSEDDDD